MEGVIFVVMFGEWKGLYLLLCLGSGRGYICYYVIIQY